ncbi:MAG: hypothetical protein JW863_17460, partial [Chitinispirillaceae bacterium]|nr:hypothetical protein [Chitinispirillaceae bacterium]
NTTMKKIPSATGWGDPMKVVPKLFAEYNSKTASGSAVDLSGRRTTYTKDATTVTINPVLTGAQAAQYTIPNVLAGSDNWKPDASVRQVSAPVVGLDGSKLVWNDNDSALCWVVFRDDKYYECVTAPECAVADGDNDAEYYVRTANAMGGLGAPSAPFDPTSVRMSAVTVRQPVLLYYNSRKRTIRLEPQGAGDLKLAVFSLNGRMCFSRHFTEGVSPGNVELPIAHLMKGTYLVEVEVDGVADSRHLTVF